MKTMQKIFTLLLASALLFTLPACTKYGEGAEQTNETTATATATEITDETTVTATETTANQAETPDTPAEEYTGILTYDYAYEARYYSCMYVTPDTVHIWNSATEPNVNDPTASDGFAQAYTEPLPRTQFEQATAAVTEDFLYGAQKGATLARVATLATPETHIAVYLNGELCRHRHGIGIVRDIREPTADFRALHAKLEQIRDGIVPQAPSDQVPQIVAILQYRQAGDMLFNAKYYTEEKTLTWMSTQAPNFSAPLEGPDRILQREYPATSLPTALRPYAEHLPMHLHQDSQSIVTDDALDVMVFYRQDGSMRIVSTYSTNHSSWLWATFLANIAYQRAQWGAIPE